MPPHLIDTHCHLNFDPFDSDRSEVLQRAHDAGVVALVNPSVDLADSQRVVALAQEIPNLYAAIGFHPNDAASFNETTLAALRTLAQQPKVVAVGEIGLDYYWNTAPPEVQKAVFEQQLALATELNLPVIIHQRDAAADTLAILQTWASNPHPDLVLHSFSGDMATAKMALELGFYLGISGPITFKNPKELPEVVAYAPLSRLLVETDAPFLSPHPYRGKRNEPAQVKLVAEKIAQIKGLSYADTCQQLTQNSLKFFKLPVS